MLTRGRCVENVKRNGELGLTRITLPNSLGSSKNATRIARRKRSGSSLLEPAKGTPEESGELRLPSALIRRRSTWR